MQSVEPLEMLLWLVACQGTRLLATSSSGTCLSQHVQTQPQLAALRCFQSRGLAHGVVRCDINETLFLQTFLNQVVAKAVKKRLAMHLKLPADIFACTETGFAAAWVNVHPQQNNTLTWTPCLGQGWQADVVRETWKTWSNMPEHAGLVLSSSSVDDAHLGDFVAFCLTLMPIFHNSVLFGLGLMLVREIGNWLEQNTSRLVSWNSSSDDPIPMLQGLCRARRLDPRLMVQAVLKAAQAGKSTVKQDGVDRKAARVFCHLYGQLVAASFSKAGTLTKTVLVDGCRNFGETMDLYFSYSPWLNVGAWLPFQVPLFPVVVVEAWAHSHTCQVAPPVSRLKPIFAWLGQTKTVRWGPGDGQTSCTWSL